MLDVTRSVARAISVAFALFSAGSPAAQRPNILWLTSEDNGPHLGCYGDPDADTPNLDALAERALRYDCCWSNAPVCAPARTTLITGRYPTASGAQHMRSMAPLPDGVPMFPTLLRAAGYWCTNNSKTDYNHPQAGAKVWDVSSRKAHWRSRADGQPFFAVFNSTATHESRIRKRPHEAVHDPQSIRVPGYHPDLPEVRQDWAQYHDQMTVMDRQLGKRLAELEADGLVDDTIVFYFGDHGPGLARCKRTACDSGLRVPLLVSIPDRFAHLRPPGYAAGAATDRPVAFVDFAATVLSLAGVEPPAAGLHGSAFAGRDGGAERAPYVFGFRGRMDERYDLVRAVRDERFVYVLHLHPHERPGQHVDYLFQTPTTRAWRAAYERDELAAVHAAFWREKPTEQLFDLRRDPDEVDDLAAADEHAERVAAMRAACLDHMDAVGDAGFLPEDELWTWVENGRPVERVVGAGPAAVRRFAVAAARRDPARAGRLVAALDDDDVAVRYWGALGLLMLGADCPSDAWPRLVGALDDAAPSVRIVAAEAVLLAGPSTAAAREPALGCLIELGSLETQELPVVLQALNALDAVDEHAEPVRARIAALPRQHDRVPRRQRNYVGRLLAKILADLDAGK